MKLLITMKSENMKWSRLLFMAALATLMIAMGCSKDDPIIEEEEAELVSIPDALLLAEVKAALGLGAAEDVNVENILELDTLVLDAGEKLTLADLADLTGLQAATNLVYLHFGGTAVTDISPISGLRKVQYLRFNNTAVTDLSALSAYTTLTYFNINTVTGVTNISPIAGNTGLKEIILRDVPFGNDGMATIANFTSLYRINMRGTGVTDITVLGQLMAGGALLDTTPGAETAGGADLDLRGLSVEDWTPIAPYLSQISNLEGVPDNEPVNVPDSRLLAQIKLALGLEEGDDLTTLYMLNLKELNLDAEDDLLGDLSEIADLTGLEYAENLTYLHLGYTSVTDLTPIQDLEKVTYLRINNTAVTDLSPVANYTSLTYFNANTARGITDISPLAGNTGIKEIILREVPFGNAGMATIRNFTSMYRINMRSTGVTDITVLAELMAEGALLDSTPGAEEAGGADLDLRGLTIDCSLIAAYLDQISNIEGCP